MKPSHRDAFGLALALAVALAAHRFVLELELMGWDSYPTIAASRIGSFADFLGSFSEELMDGRYPHGSFYRPVTNLVFALDHAAWGIDPRGYHATNLAILLAGVVAVWGLGRRWLGSGGAASVAALVFALHPLQLESVPVAARRADMLFTLFLVCALWVQPLGTRAGQGAIAACTALVLLAAASKDTGAVALPVVMAAQWWLPAEGTARARTLRTLRRCAAPAAGFALFLAARSAALGGIGGHPESEPIGGLFRGLANAPGFARALLMPQPWSERPVLDVALVALLATGLAAALGLAARHASPAPGDGRWTEARPPTGRVAVFLAGWVAALAAMTGISGERASWYGVPFLPAYALAVGLAAEGAFGALRAGRRRVAAGAGLAVLALVASHLRYSALVQSYEEWSTTSDQARAFLTRFESAVVEARPGTTIVLPGLPLGTGTPLERVGIRSALCLSDYSVAAYAELAHPGLPVRVALQPGGEHTPPTPGTVTIDVVPLPGPVLGALP